MLYELKKHPDSIVQPFVDGIDAGSIEYTAPGEIYTGSFSWDLRFVDPHKSVATMILISKQRILKKPTLYLFWLVSKYCYLLTVDIVFFLGTLGSKCQTM